MRVTATWYAAEAALESELGPSVEGSFAGNDKVAIVGILSVLTLATLAAVASTHELRLFAVALAPLGARDCLWGGTSER
jgi:hypothetical protein